MCPDCGQPIAACICKQVQVPADDSVVRVRLETKGRKGKGVTVISGVPLAAPELADLCKQLKQRCGSGGTVKDSTIEIQGDHSATVIPLLKKRGWRVQG